MTKAKELVALANGAGCLARSADDEPVFILVARDIYAAGIVREWAMRVADDHGHSTKTIEALDLAKQMDEWRKAHGGGKVPE